MTISETPQPKMQRPIRFLTVGLILNVAVLSWLGWGTYDSYRKYNIEHREGEKIVALRGRILQLDEVLTMSARMAAASGDPRWERRYHKFEPELDGTIKEAMEIVPDAGSSEAAARTDEANRKLVAMEYRAFDLIREGKADQARALLSSDLYETQKQIYAEGMHNLERRLSETHDRQQVRTERMVLLHTGAAILLIGLTIAGWLVGFRITQKWQATLKKSNLHLTQQAVDLSQLNRTLDEKVTERTRDLTERVKELRCLYEVFRSIGERQTLADVFRDLVEVIPSSWQYPDITRGRVVFDGQEYLSAPFEPTEWKQSSDIVVDGQSRGVVEVYYLEPCPPSDEGPFLTEERHLIDALANALERVIERKAREADRMRLTTALDQAAEAMVVTDLEGTIEYVNPAFEEMTGYSTAEAIGQNPRILNSGQHDETFYGDLWDTIRRGEVWRGHFVNRMKDGTLYEEEETISPVKDDEGRPFCYVAVKRNVTCEVKLQAELVRARRLKAMGQLASGIAHEINTPIQYVGDNVRFFEEGFGALSGLLRQYSRLLEAARAGPIPDALTNEVAEAAEQADAEYLLAEIPLAIQQSLEGIGRVSAIVGAMKEFSQPGVDTMVALDINKALESAITVSRNEWKYVAEFQRDFDPSVPRVLCLPGEVNQVFLDLIINAAQAINDAGEADAEHKGTITASTRQSGDHVEIRISDTGTGIPTEIHEKIFDPFFTTRDPGKGIGQGLARTQAVIVERHGGSIDFETKIGQGTTFIVRLPTGTPTESVDTAATEVTHA